VSVLPVDALDVARPARLSPMVSLRDEAFGAMAYHHGNRRLVFLKSRELVALVRDLEHHANLGDAITAHAPAGQFDRYLTALSSLQRSEILDVG